MSDETELDIDLKALSRPIGRVEQDDTVDYAPEDTYIPPRLYTEPYPLDNRQLEDKIETLQKRQMFLTVGVVGAIFLSAMCGRLVLKLVQGQAQMDRNMRDLVAALGLDTGQPASTETVVPEHVQPTAHGTERKVVESNEDDAGSGVERPFSVSDPFELGSPKHGHVDLPDARGGREPFRSEE